MTDGSGSTTYGYDLQGRVTLKTQFTSAVNAPACNEAFAYDLIGNRTSQTVAGIATTLTAGMKRRPAKRCGERRVKIRRGRRNQKRTRSMRGQSRGVYPGLTARVAFGPRKRAGVAFPSPSALS